MVNLESETEFNNCFSLDKACQSDNYLKNLLEIIETHPSESASQFGKSIIYYILDDYDKVLDYLEPLSESFPNLSLLHRRIAEAYIHQNKFSRAVNHLEKAVEINDKDLTAKVWLILLYFKVGKAKQASINFQELTELVFVLDVSEKSFTGL
jgi:tetratricopeptide (TPR) repeat protein